MKSSRSLALISALFLLAALAAAADLSGRITFRGQPLAGAVVTANLIGATGGGSATITRTDARGQYLLRGLRDGKYVMLVDLNGRRIYQGEIAVSGATFEKDIALQ